jgi:hypothetical protein
MIKRYPAKHDYGCWAASFIVFGLVSVAALAIAIIALAQLRPDAVTRIFGINGINVTQASSGVITLNGALQMCVDTVDVYVDYGAGSDTANTGMTRSSPLRTIEKAVWVLSGATHCGINAIIHLLGTTPHYIGDGYTLNFAPTTILYSNIIVRGEEIEQIGAVDTIVSLTNSGPFDSWKTVRGATFSGLQTGRFFYDIN